MLSSSANSCYCTSNCIYTYEYICIRAGVHLLVGVSNNAVIIVFGVVAATSFGGRPINVQLVKGKRLQSGDDSFT